LPGFASTGWIGLLAPKGTPKPIIDKLHAALVKTVNDPETAKIDGTRRRRPGKPTPRRSLPGSSNDEWKNFGDAIRIAKLKAY